MAEERPRAMIDGMGSRRAEPLREYHEGPRLIIEAMERWLSEDDRAAQAARVRAWIAGAYGLDPIRECAPAKTRPASASRRRTTG